MVKLKHLVYVLFHPFDGFFEARHRGKGSMWVAFGLFVLWGISQIITVQYTGFILNYWHLYGLESSELFVSGTLPVIMFVISNWSVTTLMNGNGRFRDVFMVTCYSLAPMIFFSLLTTALSNVIILGEVIILQAFSMIGVVWFLFLTFSGLCVIHEYSAGKNVLSLVATFIAAMIILFLGVLYLTLMDTVSGFVQVIRIEIMNRWF